MSNTSITSELTAWEKQTVADLFDLEGGFAFKSSDFLEDGVPVIKIKNVKAGFFSKHDFSFVSETFLAARPRKVARQSDLLISMSGNRHDGSPETWVGKVAYFDAPEKYLINQRVGALRVKDARKADPRFFSYLLSSFSYQELFIAIATSSGGQANLSPGQILSAPVFFPKLAEQQRIAHILGTLDDKIELNRRMAATLEEMARSIFKSWFIDFDPVRAKSEGRPTGLPPEIDALFPDEFEESELGLIPRGWRTEPLSEICSISRKTAKPFSFPETTFEHYSLPAFDSAEMPLPTLGCDIKSNKNVVVSGSVLVSKLNPETPRVWAPELRLGVLAICSTEFIVLVPAPSVGRDFLYLLMQSPLMRLKLEGLVTGTSKSHQRVQPKSMLKLEVIIPNNVILRHFAFYVNEVFKRKNACLIESQLLTAIRDFLLPRLISGEVDAGSA